MPSLAYAPETALSCGDAALVDPLSPSSVSVTEQPGVGTDPFA
jgi:hypothetical protein